MRRVPFASVVCVLVLAITSASSQTCAPGWSDGFAGRGFDSSAYAATVADIGQGPTLFVGGAFTRANGVQINRVARWTGTSWAPLGAGTDHVVNALAAYDSGSGTQLYAAGYFQTAGGVYSPGVARWNGAQWSAPSSIPGGSGDFPVRALKVFNSGTGPQLYAAGTFGQIHGVPAHRIARWNGSQWSPLTNATINGEIYALEVFNDGTGPALFAAGTFDSIGGGAYSHVAKWNGTSWSPLGTGCNANVYSLGVYDDGTGPALVAGGVFSTAGSQPINCLARWNGSAWSAIGGGVIGNPASGSQIVKAAARNDGGGTKLYACGVFTIAGGPLTEVAAWNGSAWSVISPAGAVAIGQVYDLTESTGPDGPGLVGVGEFAELNGAGMSGVARLHGTTWSPMPDGDGCWSNGPAAMVMFDDGSGPALYAAMSVATSGVYHRGVVRWNGTSWSAVGGFTFGETNALAAIHTGPARGLYLGGTFTSAGGVPAQNIARWNGTSWAALGSGLVGTCRALMALDVPPTPPLLVVGGPFSSAGGVPSARVAIWNGSAWSATGGSGIVALNTVEALGFSNAGSGPALYAGGATAASAGLWRLAGPTWQPVATTSTAALATITSLATYTDAIGPALYAAGPPATATPPGAILQLRGATASWLAAAGGPTTPFVQALTTFDDGTGMALYAGGDFAAIGGIAAHRIARWNGSSWSPLGSGIDGPGLPSAGGVRVTSFGAFDDGAGPVLYVGGGFATAGGVASDQIARWGLPRPAVAFTVSSAGVTVRDRRMRPGHEYLGLCSMEPCAPLGSGPWLGLCFSDPADLLAQIAIPIDVPPYHFAATWPNMTFGPYVVQPGTTIEAVTADVTNAVLGCYSPVTRVVVP